MNRHWRLRVCVTIASVIVKRPTRDALGGRGFGSRVLDRLRCNLFQTQRVTVLSQFRGGSSKAGGEKHLRLTVLTTMSLLLVTERCNARPS